MRSTDSTIWMTADELEERARDMAKIATDYREPWMQFDPRITRRMAIRLAQGEAARCWRKAQDKRQAHAFK